jgi:uncharacterized membrane protein YcaP (DUF421 family)
VRLAGKRTIREGTPFDLVVALLISDLPDDIIWGEVPLEQGLVAVTTLFLIHLLVVRVVYLSPLLGRVIESGPSPMIQDGKRVPRNLAFERIPGHLLDALLRERRIDEPTEAQNAWLEPSGALSVKRTAEAEFAVKGDLPRVKELVQKNNANSHKKGTKP